MMKPHACGKDVGTNHKTEYKIKIKTLKKYLKIGRIYKDAVSHLIDYVIESIIIL